MRARRGLIWLARDERGVSVFLVAVTLFAIMAVSMMAIDGGSLYTTRRNLITGTDAAALDAARYFNTGQGDPCSGAGQTAAEADARNVLLQNNTNSLHDSSNTPNGFQVTTAIPCGTASYIPGKVRFDARLNAHMSLAGMFGFSNLQAFSSSTAAWGYITGLGSGSGLRPMSICDQHSQSFPNPLPAAPAAPYYPHFALWNMLQAGTINQTTYDSFFGTDAANYPSVSGGFSNGDDNNNPNKGKPYVTPTGTNGHSTIHRVTMPDPLCGVSPGNRIWVDFTGPGGGTGGGTAALVSEILSGYTGTVDLSPHDCNPSDSTPAPEDCGSKPGNSGGVQSALGTIVCDVNTAAMNCPYIFPILVISSITKPGATANYTQVAFLFVVLRGFSKLTSNSLQFDYEFVSVQTDGNIGSTSPSGSDTEPKGVQLCGVDHDTTSDRCGF